MAGQIFLFTGEDHYSLRQELQRWKSQFVEKYGQDSLSVFGVEDDVAQAVGSMRGGGLFSHKKMVVVYGAPLDTVSFNKRRVADVDSLIQACEQLSDDVLLVLVSYKPDKRTSGYKFFKTAAQIKDFKALTGKTLVSHVAKKSDGLLSYALAEHLVSVCGNDMYRLMYELDKLFFYTKKTGQTLSQEVIDSVVFGELEANNFAFLDNLFVNQKKAIAVLDDAEESGTPWMLFVGALYWGLRIMIQMMYLYQSGKQSTGVLAKEIGCPPFTLGRYLKFVDLLWDRKEAVLEFWDFVQWIDFGVKSGRFPDSAFWPLIKQRVYALS